MKKIFFIGGIVVIVSLMLTCALPVATASTPTFVPHSTSTSASAYLHATPTDYVFSGGPSIAPTFDAYTGTTVWTDSVISIYHAMNHTHIMDFIISMSLILLIVWLIIHNVGSEIQR